MREILERLAAANIQLLPVTQIEKHWIFERDGFIALVERTGDGGFGRMGTPGLWTERGLAVLIQRGQSKAFVTKGIELAASSEQVESMRSFARDLEAALKL
ncbi:MAG: hypothetical protein HY235_22295 [Acidobacteria bacterium]|nr:hypothetical protein [Acidobacteriota bacterium]